MSAIFSIRFVNCIDGAPQVASTWVSSGNRSGAGQKVSWSVKIGLRLGVMTGFDYDLCIPLTYNVGTDSFIAGSPAITSYVPATYPRTPTRVVSSFNGGNWKWTFPSFADVYGEFNTMYLSMASPYRADAFWRWVLVRTTGSNRRWDLRFSDSEERPLYPTWRKVF